MDEIVGIKIEIESEQDYFLKVKRKDLENLKSLVYAYDIGNLEADPHQIKFPFIEGNS